MWVPSVKEALRQITLLIGNRLEGINATDGQKDSSMAEVLRKFQALML